MSSKRRQRLVLLAAITAAAVVAGGLYWALFFREPPEGRPVDALEVLGWLPEDTETVIHAGGSYVMPPPVNVRSENLESLAQSLPGIILSEIAGGALRRTFENRRLSFCIEGSRGFRAPQSLGLSPYEGASILVFEEPLGNAGRELLREVNSNGGTTKVIGWERVVVRQEKLESDTWTILLAQPWQRVLVIATNEDYLREVLTGMRQSSGRRPLPKHIEEGLQRIGSSRYWAIRRYEPARAADDPSSPLAPQAAANEPDPAAKGLLFAFDPARSKEAIVTYLSGNDRAVEIAKKFWTHPQEDFSPLVRQAGPGIVEIVCASEGRGVMMFHFVLIAALGHCVFI